MNDALAGASSGLNDALAGASAWISDSAEESGLSEGWNTIQTGGGKLITGSGKLIKQGVAATRKTASDLGKAYEDTVETLHTKTSCNEQKRAFKAVEGNLNTVLNLYEIRKTVSVGFYFKYFLCTIQEVIRTLTR